MTAVEILKVAIGGTREGIDACHQRPNAVTPNHVLATILTSIERAMSESINQIHEGNVK